MKPHEAYWRLTPVRMAIGGVAIVALIIVGRCAIGFMFSSGEAHAARERVSEMLGAMGPGGSAEVAIALWSQGAHRVSGGQEAFNSAADDFFAWRQEKKLGTVTSFVVESTRELPEKGRYAQATIEVSGKVNGTPFRCRVQRGEKIAWLD